MAKSKANSKKTNSPTLRKTLKVVLNRIDTREHVPLQNPVTKQLKVNIKNLKLDKILKVHIEKLPIPQITPTSSQKRRRSHKTYTSKHIKNLRRRSRITSSQSSSLPVSRTSPTPSPINKRRKLYVPIRPIDVRNALDAISRLNSSPIQSEPMTTTTTSPPAITSPIPAPELLTTPHTTPPSIHAPTPIPSSTPAPVPVPTPAPAPITAPAVPPRRRHAPIPRRITHHKAIDVSPEELEELAENPFSCGPFSNLCNKCGAKFFSKEPKNRAGIRLLCCKDGKISIPIPACPPELKPLYTQHSERSNEFLANIRAANSLFAMASFKTSAPNTVVEGQGR